MQRFKQPNMDLHPDGEWIRYEDHVEAMKRIAGDTIPPITAGFIRAYDEVNGPIPAAPSASAQPAKLDADLLTTIREAAAKKAEGAITKDGRAVFINYGDSEQQMLDGAEMACPHCGGSGHKDDLRPVASPAALTAGDQQTLKLIYDAMSMGTGARTLANLLACIENVKHHADCIDAVEREFFMVPGEPDEDDPDSEPGDECLLNRWGSTVEQYVEQFRFAIPHLLAASPADQVGWQPIETAPKDREVWAFNGEQGRMQWSEGSADNGEGWALWVWCDPLLSDVDPEPEQPTHFMPLPADPVAAMSASKEGA